MPRFASPPPDPAARPAVAFPRVRLVLIVLYLVVTRIGHLQAAKLGITIGPVPIFLTDMVIGALLVASFFATPGKMALWVVTGRGADVIGGVIWLLMLLSVGYLANSFSDYRILALKDFAIVAYSLFFIVTYFAIASRADAEMLVQVFAYSGVALAVLVVLNRILSLGVPFLRESQRLTNNIVYSGLSGDVGGIVAFSLAATIVYLIVEQRHRLINLGCVMACAAALALATTRSSVVGFVMAMAFTFLVMRSPGRVIGFLVIVGTLVGLIAVSPMLPRDLPGMATLQGYNLAISSGTTLIGDTNFAFRWMRWELALDLWAENPVLGVGFGAPILPDWVISMAGPESGKFNAGLPHNTFLTLLARMGLVGFGLHVFAWILAVWRLSRTLIRRGVRAADLAAANSLIAMAGFAGFVLFFERPMHGATFWIMLAVATRLSQSAQVPARNEGGDEETEPTTAAGRPRGAR